MTEQECHEGMRVVFTDDSNSRFLGKTGTVIRKGLGIESGCAKVRFDFDGEQRSFYYRRFLRCVAKFRKMNLLVSFKYDDLEPPVSARNGIAIEHCSFGYAGRFTLRN